MIDKHLNANTEAERKVEKFKLVCVERLRKASDDCCYGRITVDDFNTIFEELTVYI